MDLEKLNKWLTPLTNLAVLFGLFLIVVELRQNQESMALDRRLAALDSTHLDFSNVGELRRMVIIDPAVADLYIRGTNGEKLTEVDQLRFWYICQDLHWSAVMMYDRAVNLGMDEYAEATVDWIKRTLNRKGMKSCWDNQKVAYVSYGYSDFVDAVDRPTDDTSTDSQ